MRKNYYKKYLTMVALAIVTLLPFNAAAQGAISISILYGEVPVTNHLACQKQTVMFTTEVVGGSGTGHTYTWVHNVPSPHFSDIDDSFVIKNTAPAGTYTLKVTVVDDAANTASATVNVIVRPSPSPSITAGTNPTTFCYGGNVELKETATSGTVTYQWQKDLADIAGAIANTHVVTTSGSYRVRVVAANTCSATSSPIAVTVNPLPETTVASNSPVCNGDQINLTSGPGGAYTYSWASTATTAFSSTIQNPSIASATPNNSGTYTVTVTDNTTLCKKDASTGVVVNAAVSAGVIGSPQTICYGATPNALTSTTDPSGGRGTFTHEWKQSVNAGVTWTTITGATSLTYAPSALTQTTQFKRISTNTCGSAETAPVAITVYSEENGGTIAADQSICYNTAPAAFTSAAPATGGDAGAWQYKWELQPDGASTWTPIAGATSLGYTHGVLTATTKFRRAATNTTCSKTVYSNEITVTVHKDINPGTIAADQSVCYNGDPVAFTATEATGGTGTTTYWWESKVGSGAWTSTSITTQTYDVPAGITQTTSYRRVAKNSCGQKESNVITVTVHSEMQPGSISYTGGSLCYNSDPAEITSTAPATGGFGAWTYKWYYQSKCTGAWVEIAGATALTYDPPANQTETRCYKRVGTNATCGDVETTPVTITIEPDVAGGTIATDQSVCHGDDPAAFTSTTPASGGIGAFTYSWQWKVGSGAWTDIAGATAITYDAPAGITQTTLYRRGAVNTCNVKAYSNEITVTVADAVNGGVIAAPAAVCYNGDPATITSTTAPSGGTGAWSYSWEYKVGGGAWTTIPSSNALTYDPPASQTQTRQYRRKSTNSCGYGYSNEVEVKVWGNPVAGTIAANQTICYKGDPAPITSATLPTGGNTTTAWTYKWEYQSNCAGAWTEITGATGASYDPPADLTENRCYRRVEVDECQTLYSNIITVTVGAPLNPGTIAANQSICSGSNVAPITSVTAATGDGAVTYFWQMSTSGAWANITGETGMGYAPAAGSITETTKFRRAAKDKCNTEYSNEITVTVNALPNVTLADLPGLCLNASPITLSGGSPVPPPGTGVYKVNGTVASTFNPTTAGTYTVTYTYTDGNSCTNTATKSIVVHPLPTVFNVTGGGDYCESSSGAEVGLDGSATGVTYTLVKNSTPTATTVAGTGVAISFGKQQEGTYTVQAMHNTTNCQSAMNGSVVNVKVSEIANNSITADQTICSGSTPAQLNGSTPTGGSGTYTYQWYSSTTSSSAGFVIVTGAISQNYTPATLTQTTWYRRMVKSGACESESNAIKITVNKPIANNTVAAEQTICYNATPSNLVGSTPTNGSGTYTYQWQSSSTGVVGSFTDIAGATSKDYQPGVLIASTWYCRVVSSAPCDNNFSAAIKITVNAEFTVQNFTTQDPTCNGATNGSATAVLQGGVAPITYSWNTSPVQTTATATGLSAGVVYTVTATDANNCTATGTITLTEPDVIDLALPIVVTPVDGCHGEAKGAIEVLAKGGTPIYTYTLSKNSVTVGTKTGDGVTKVKFNNLPAGTYSLSITDKNGCTPYVDNSIIITEPAILVVDNVTTTPISCNGSTDGTITITASGGTTPYSYSIDGGATYDINNVLTVGEGYYDIRVKDAKGCIATWATQVEMVEPSKINFSYTITPITSCNGNSEGAINIFNVSGGSGTGYQYSITNPETWGNDPTFINLPGGNSHAYYIKVRDSHNCISAANDGNPIYINQPPVITFTVKITHVTGCWYNTNGEIRITSVIGGTGAKKFSLDGVNYVTTPAFAVGVGAHTVYVRDANGCVAQQTVTVNGPDPIVLNSITVTDVTCFGSLDGRVDFTASGGTGPLEYSLDDITYQSANTYFIGLSAGNKTLFIRDANGCVLATDFTVGHPAVLYFKSAKATNITCHGLVDGTITLVGSGGNGNPLQYSINGGVTFYSNGGVFTGLTAGTYTPAVTDGTCSVLGEDLTIVEPALIQILTATSTDITCNGADDGTITVTATGGTGALTYNLYSGVLLIASNGSGVFTSLVAGTYTVKVSDANYCLPTVSGPLTVDEPTAVTFTHTHTDLSCFGYNDGTITITPAGGAGAPYEYSINGAAFVPLTGTIANLAGGTYTIVVRDGNLCESMPDDIVVLEPDAIDLKLTPKPITCNGLTDGVIEATATGGNSGSYQFRLNGGAWQASGTFSNLAAGNYAVEIFDGSCAISKSTTVTEPEVIKIDSVTTTNVLCGGAADGGITAYASGGTGTLTYSLYDNASVLLQTNTNGIFTGLAGGTYRVEVGDANSCPVAISAPIVLTEPVAVSFTYVATNIVCNGDANGKIAITGIGGNGTYFYSVNSGAFVAMAHTTTDTIKNLLGGTYTIVVRDGNGCASAPQSITIIESPVLTITLAGTNITCNGAANGTITATALGGNALSYEYRIDGGAWQASNTFTVAAAGVYLVEVRDANGCIRGASHTIEEPIAITIASVVAVNPSCTAQGSITAEATGGSGTLTYTLLPNSISNTTGVFDNLPGGTYTVSVDDADGCGPVTSAPQTLTDPVLITINSVVVQDVTPCQGDTTGTITITASGGTPPLRYSIDGGTTYQPSNQFTKLLAGTYNIVVNDASDCPQSTTATVNEPAPINIVSVNVSQETVPNANDGAITVVASGGVAPLTYTLRPTGTTNTTGIFTNLGTNMYYVEVTDALGCTKRTKDIEIGAVEIIVTKTNITCYGASNGTVNVTINGGFAPYTVGCASVVHGTSIPMVCLDPPTGTQFQATGLSVDTLIITIVNRNGRVFPSRQVEITQPDTMVVTMVSATGPLCAGENTGSVVFNITGGTPAYTVSWADTSTTATTITGLAPGSYSFTVTDANGCTSAPLTATLNNPDSIKVSIAVVQETSYNAGNGIVAITATGGTGAYTYVLQPTGASEIVGLFNNLSAGTYFVQVFDANGCMEQSQPFIIRGTDFVVDTLINVACYGDSTGSFKFTINHGFHPFKVACLNSSNDTIPLVACDTIGRSFEAKKLVVGMYFVHITDSLSNVLPPYQVEVLQPDSLIANISKLINPLCHNDSTGVVEFVITGGTPTYQISWGTSSVIGTQVDSLAGGNYSFTITDAHGCQTLAIDTTLLNPTPIILSDTVIINPICYGQPLGSIELFATGGATPYTYQFGAQPADTISLFSNLVAGVYSITVTDTLGCFSTFNFTLKDTTKITIAANIYGEDMTCPYDTQGSIKINVTGGYGGYQYIWPQLDNTSDSVSGLNPGQYIVMVVDMVNCMVSDTFNISGPAQFIFNPSVISQASCRHSLMDYDGALSVGGTGGNVGAIAYRLISPDGDTLTVGSPNFVKLAAGPYVIIAEDSKGCLYERLDTIPINPLYDFKVVAPDTVVCFANNVTLAGTLQYDTLFNQNLEMVYEWWNQNNSTSTPDGVGVTYSTFLPESKIYRFKLRATLKDAPKCYEEDWADVSVYPKIGVHVPLYVSSVQYDTIISVLFGHEYNIDVNTQNVEYATTFQWYPSEMFINPNSWNSSILLTKEIYNEIYSKYPQRFVELKDPKTRINTKFIITDVVATTEVGCVDSLKLYTKIVNKLYLANVFSPNGDGRNDIWRIPKDYLFPDLEVEIFNRWGSLVWSARGEKAAQGWDGKTDSGKALPIGTYWYVIRFNINSQETTWNPITGSVTIVK